MIKKIFTYSLILILNISISYTVYSLDVNYNSFSLFSNINKVYHENIEKNTLDITLMEININNILGEDIKLKNTQQLKSALVGNVSSASIDEKLNLIKKINDIYFSNKEIEKEKLLLKMEGISNVLFYNESLDDFRPFDIIDDLNELDEIYFGDLEKKIITPSYVNQINSSGGFWFDMESDYSPARQAEEHITNLDEDVDDSFDQSIINNELSLGNNIGDPCINITGTGSILQNLKKINSSPQNFIVQIDENGFFYYKSEVEENKEDENEEEDLEEEDDNNKYDIQCGENFDKNNIECGVNITEYECDTQFPMGDKYIDLTTEIDYSDISIISSWWHINLILSELREHTLVAKTVNKKFLNISANFQAQDFLRPIVMIEFVSIPPDNTKTTLDYSHNPYYNWLYNHAEAPVGVFLLINRDVITHYLDEFIFDSLDEKFAFANKLQIQKDKFNYELEKRSQQYISNLKADLNRNAILDRLKNIESYFENISNMIVLPENEICDKDNVYDVIKCYSKIFFNKPMI